MTWQPDGECYSFDGHVIRTFAPETSGVYGLYNLNDQLYIGEAENIRHALLRHLSDDSAQSRRYQPSGFSFKTCPAELRKSNAEALIKIYQPILQSELASADKFSLSLGATASEAGLGASADKPDFETHGMNLPNHKDAAKIARRFYFDRAQGVVLAATFVVSAAVIFYLGILTGENIRQGPNVVIEERLARIPVVAPRAEPAEIDSAPQSISAIAPAKEAVNDKGAPPAAKLEVPDASPVSSRVSRPGQISAVDPNLAHPDGAAASSKNPPVAPGSGAVFEAKSWSVQIAASAEKNVADVMVQRLAAKGYDSFVVEAEVNGKTWYRVRVGRSMARQEADKLRQLLDAKEGLRGAYAVRD